MSHENGFNEYKPLILDKLESIETKMDRLESKFQEICNDVAVLKVKSGVWNTVAAALGVMVIIITGVLSGVFQWTK